MGNSINTYCQENVKTYLYRQGYEGMNKDKYASDMVESDDEKDEEKKREGRRNPRDQRKTRNYSPGQESVQDNEEKETESSAVHRRKGNYDGTVDC